MVREAIRASNSGVGVPSRLPLKSRAADRRLLAAIIDKFGGGPVGVENLAIAVNEEIDTLTDVTEPFLIQSGLIARTPRGRVVTAKGYSHQGRKAPKKEPELF